MQIINKKKFIVRIIEVVVILATIILTVLAINYATKLRGYRAIGGEYLIPILGLLLVLIIEEVYKESEKNKPKHKK